MKKYLLFFLGIGVLTLYSCIGEPPPPPIKGIENPAITTVSEQIKYNPDDPELYLTRASLYYEMEYYDEAASDMKIALSHDSSSIAYRHVLADIYFDGNKDNEALGLLEETIGLFPASEATLLKLSEFQYLLQFEDSAIKTIDKLMKVKPDHVEGNYMYGRIFSQKGNKEKSILHYKKALEKNPKHFDSLLELGTLYSLDKSEKALEYLNQAKGLSPNNPDVIFELGNYHRFQGNDKKALDFYKQTIFIDNQYADAHINAGIINFEKKEYSKALDFFNIAVETDPASPAAYYYRGITHAYLNDKSKAKNDLQNALELAPDYEDAKNALLDLER